MITRSYTGVITSSTTLVQSQDHILFTVMCIFVTQTFDLSRYVHITWFGPGTQEYILTQDITHLLYIFFLSDESLIHSLDYPLMKYLQTIELPWGLGQSPGILTHLIVFLRT